MSFSLILSSDKSDFTTVMNSIILNSDYQYEASLQSIDTYNSIPNITEGINNSFKYFNGSDWKTILLKTGSYELDSMGREIHRLMLINGDDADAITILPEISTLRSIVNIVAPAMSTTATPVAYKVAFEDGSIARLLGFPNGVLNAGYNLSPNIVDIMPINTILVNIDIIQGSYINGQASPAIYAFYPAVSPGFKIIERPNNLTYFKLSRNDISRIRVWLTDQDNNIVDFRGERITIRIHIRQT